MACITQEVRLDYDNVSSEPKKYPLLLSKRRTCCLNADQKREEKKKKERKIKLMKERILH